MQEELFQRYFAMLQAGLCAALMWGSVLFAARRFARRALPAESLSLQFCATGVFALAIIIVTVQVMGAFACLTRWPTAAICASWALVAALTTRKITNCQLSIVNSPGHRGESDWAHCLAWCRRRVTDGYGLLACVVGVLVFQALTRALRSPPLSWDSLTYHAFLPARWVQLGSLAPFAAPGGMDGYRAMPFNLELLAAFLMLPFGNDLFLNLLNPPLILLTAIAAYALARQAGASERIAVWAPLLFCFSPAFWSLATTQYSDILVAASLACGAIFLVRFVQSNGWADLILTALCLGIACGTKFTALPAAFVAGLVILVREFTSSGNRSRRAIRLPTCLALAAAVGAYKYVESWWTLGNPLYPVEVSVGGYAIFEGSPMQKELMASQASAKRADDWQVVKFLVSSRPFTWGPKFIVLVPLAGWCLLRAGPQRRNAVVLLLLTAYVAAQFLPQHGLAELTRRVFTDSFCRSLAFPFLLVTCLAVAAIDRWRLPRGLIAVVPTLLLILDARNGRFPQPPSFNEIICVIATVLLICHLLVRPKLSQIHSYVPLRRLALPLLVLALILGPLTLDVLQQKRDRARYTHYASSTDFHDIPRGLVNGWRACDDPRSPHTIAYVRRHKPDAAESMHYINTRWFFYPLLGSNLQNRVVYASVHEVRDLPTRPYLAALRSDVREEAWLENLRRLNADRLFVVRGADPEQRWIARRPQCFEAADQGDEYVVYKVNQRTLRAANTIIATDSLALDTGGS